jgi:hypothetical protein
LKEEYMNQTEILSKILELLEAHLDAGSTTKEISNDLDLIREALGTGYTEIADALSAKTGWGRVQVLQIIDQAFANMQKKLL